MRHPLCFIRDTGFESPSSLLEEVQCARVAEGVDEVAVRVPPLGVEVVPEGAPEEGVLLGPNSIGYCIC